MIIHTSVKGLKKCIILLMVIYIITLIMEIFRIIIVATRITGLILMGQFEQINLNPITFLMIMEEEC